MALSSSNSSNLEQLVLKGSIRESRGMPNKISTIPYHRYQEDSYHAKHDVIFLSEMITANQYFVPRAVNSAIWPFFITLSWCLLFHTLTRDARSSACWWCSWFWSTAFSWRPTKKYQSPSTLIRICAVHAPVSIRSRYCRHRERLMCLQFCIRINNTNFAIKDLLANIVLKTKSKGDIG